MPDYTAHFTLCVYVRVLCILTTFSWIWQLETEILMEISPLMRHKHELKENRKHSESIIITETHGLISKQKNTKTVQIIQTQFDTFTTSRWSKMSLIGCLRAFAAMGA